MIWFFERGGRYLEYEIRRRPGDAGYELAITKPNGAIQVEPFDDPTALIERSVNLQARLIQQGWTPPILTRSRPANTGVRVFGRFTRRLRRLMFLGPLSALAPRAQRIRRQAAVASRLFGAHQL